VTAVHHAFEIFRVLIVDDSRTLRRILVQELNSIGIHNIVQAGDGLEALQRLKGGDIDLMLLDMEMPELDGLGVLQMLKEEDRAMSFSIIVISGADDLSGPIKCIQMGAEDYLPKPFDPVLLQARIFSSFEKMRLRMLDRQRLEDLEREKLCSRPSR
jgi:DNA-binding response OmpR family regulator